MNETNSEMETFQANAVDAESSNSEDLSNEDEDEEEKEEMLERMTQSGIGRSGRRPHDNLPNHCLTLHRCPAANDHRHYPPSSTRAPITSKNTTCPTPTTSVATSNYLPHATSNTTTVPNTSDGDSLLTCPHCDHTLASHIGLVGHM
ncbi:unnamed protein product [Schistocephalus solidus]|uniref:C2H2-type domain-containing protein n=1 Tax=Schistocephalus solidus TaxID=70667 RepID=A0A183T819_SCHSO|nr:unnamed protein product [Schistocephalus solidus]